MSAMARSTESDSPRSAKVGRASSGGAGSSVSIIVVSSGESAAAVVVSVKLWSDPGLAQWDPRRDGGGASLRARAGYQSEMPESQAKAGGRVTFRVPSRAP